MPIEIKELVIRAVVNGEPRPQASPAAEERRDPAALVEECVKRVLEILESKRER